MFRTHEKCLLLLLGVVLAIAACASAPAEPVIWNPDLKTDAMFIKVGRVWTPAEYFVKLPPTTSDEKWGLHISCRPLVRIDKSIHDKPISLVSYQPPRTVLLYSPRRVIATALGTLFHGQLAREPLCQNQVIVIGLKVGFASEPDGLGYWSPTFKVETTLGLLNVTGQLLESKSSTVLLGGFTSRSIKEQNKQLSVAGNAAVYEALAEGINALIGNHKDDL